MPDPSNPNEALARLLAAWRRDAAQYQRQVDEARQKGLPHGCMLGTASTFRECVQGLESVLADFPNLTAATVPNPQQPNPTQ